MSAIDWNEVHRRVHEVGVAIERAAEISPERARAVLEERARTLARPLADPAAGDEVHLVTFTLAGETYALETRWVVEMAGLERMTPLPGAEPPLLAVAAWRGELLTIADLRAMLGLPRAPGEPRWLVVLGEGRPELAVLADAPGEFRSLPAAVLHAAAPTERRRHVRALTDDAVVVLDGEGLLGEG